MSLIHYHNVFLIKAKNKKDAIKKVEKFLEPFDENKQHEDNNKPNLEYRGEWDWYQWGGRWMWSDLTDKYIDNIVKPGTNFYWNPYHDPEVKGKKWKLEFPDGTSVMVDYGNNYEIKTWVDNHPEHSEVLDATEDKFYEILDKYKDITNETIKGWKKDKRHWKQKGDKSMVEWLDKKIKKQLKAIWSIESYFYNITDNNQGYDIEKIKEDPSHWFLVNCDLHS